jgi:hypothetical protein
MFLLHANGKSVTEGNICSYALVNNCHMCVTTDEFWRGTYIYCTLVNVQCGAAGTRFITTTTPSKQNVY